MNPWQVPRPCARRECTNTFLPLVHNHRYCCRRCKELATGTQKVAAFRDRNPGYWEEYRKRKKLESTKRSPELVIPWNHQPCELCKRELGRTANHFYHPECLRRVTNVQCGLEPLTINLRGIS